MATSSIFADFSITDPEKAARFVDALEKSRHRVLALDETKLPPLAVKELHDVEEIRAALSRRAPQK